MIQSKEKKSGLVIGLNTAKKLGKEAEVIQLFKNYGTNLVEEYTKYLEEVMPPLSDKEAFGKFCDNKSLVMPGVVLAYAAKANVQLTSEQSDKLHLLSARVHCFLYQSAADKVNRISAVRNLRNAKEDWEAIENDNLLSAPENRLILECLENKNASSPQIFSVEMSPVSVWKSPVTMVGASARGSIQEVPAVVQTPPSEYTR